MKIHLYALTLIFTLLIPFGAPAQVDAGEDVVLECESEDGTEYTLNGSAPVGEGIVNEWTTIPEVDLDNADTLMPTGEFPVGETTAILTSTEGAGEPESDSATVTVEDNQPPVVRLRANPRYLWPPNHKMHEIEVRVRVEDRCSDEDDLTVELIRARSNEPDNGQGDGNTVNDIQDADTGSDDRNVSLRAERAGNGDGRVYTLTYRVTDGGGNETEAEAKVYVPHDASDLKDMIGDDDEDRDDMEPICRRPTDAVEQLTDLFPGLGSVRNERACNRVCKTWARSCQQIASGSAKCVKGEGKALALIAIAECKDSDDRTETRECLADVKTRATHLKGALKEDATEAIATCERQGKRCMNACEDMYGEEPVTLPVEDE
jgi:hypothetical protein